MAIKRSSLTSKQRK